MGPYKLIALDMDGTLLNEEKQITEDNRRAIREAREAGVKVMLSTGRGVQNMMSYIEELSLDEPLVAVNGSEVWKEPGLLWKRVTLDEALITKLRNIALERDIWYWSYTVKGAYNRKTWHQLPESGNEWLKFGYHTENTDVLAEVRAELESWDVLEITNSSPFNLELNPKGISKESGLRHVCEYLGIGMEQVVAMGDSLNDLAMIRAAGLGVAMGNAQDEVKREADCITGSNEESGVAQAIWRYVLGREQ